MGWKEAMPEWQREMGYGDLEWIPLEGFGMSLVEAMSCEKPVIAADYQAVREIIDNGKTGYILALKPELWAKTIEEIITNYLAISIGRAAGNAVRHGNAHGGHITDHPRYQLPAGVFMKEFKIQIHETGE